MNEQGQKFGQDLGRSTWSESLNLRSDSLTSALVFPHGHKVWAQQNPRDALKQSGSSEVKVRPMLALSPCPSPVPCGWILSLTTSLIWITRESSVRCTLGAALFYWIFYFSPYRAPVLCAQWQEGDADILLADPSECFQKIAGFLFLLLPCWAVFLHHYGFNTGNYYLQAEVNYLLSLTEKIWSFSNVFQNDFFSPSPTPVTRQRQNLNLSPVVLPIFHRKKPLLSYWILSVMFCHKADFLRRKRKSLTQKYYTREEAIEYIFVQATSWEIKIRGT